MSVASQQSEQRVLLSGISWATFESLLADTRNHGTRFTYDRGYLEMMSPSWEIERFLARRDETDETTWIRPFRAWVKTLER